MEIKIPEFTIRGFGNSKTKFIYDNNALEITIF